MGLSTEDMKRKYWPEITDLDIARKVALQGVWAALFVAGVTALFATLAILGHPVAGVDALAFVEVVIFGVLAIGIWRMSRVAALLALILFVLEKIWAFQDGQRPAGVIVAIVIIFGFLNAVRATFRYRQLLKSVQSVAGPDPISPR